jgi:RimJ/RimL family protein N-acetyltransferase
MMVVNDEIVGLAGLKAPPTAKGEVELGYGVAASRRRRGYATAAVNAVIEAARRDPVIRTIIASTAIENIGSQRALEHNGFERIGSHRDPQKGQPLLLWRKRVEPRGAALFPHSGEKTV